MKGRRKQLTVGQEIEIDAWALYFYDSYVMPDGSAIPHSRVKAMYLGIDDERNKRLRTGGYTGQLHHKIRLPFEVVLRISGEFFGAPRREISVSTRRIRTRA